MFELVRTLAERPCPAGYEEEFNRWLAGRWRPYLQSVQVTPVGNLVGRFGGSGPRLLLVAHSDEIAFVVLATLDPGQLACELWVTLSALEELGLVGAASVVRAVEVRYAIALDVGAAGDIPSVDPLDAPVRLGGGLIVVQKGHIPYTRSLTLAIEHAAGSAGIPFQRAVFEQLGTDASELIRSGVAAAAIAIPTRYTHSPFEMVDERDRLACVRLLKAVVAGGFRAGRDRA